MYFITFWYTKENVVKLLFQTYATFLPGSVITQASEPTMEISYAAGFPEIVPMLHPTVFRWLIRWERCLSISVPSFTCTTSVTGSDVSSAYDMKVIREKNFSYLSQYSNLAKINDDATMYVAKNSCMLDSDFPSVA